MSGMWKRSHGGTIEAPPDERGGNRYVLPNATAPHLDSTKMRNTQVERMSSALPSGTDVGLARPIFFVVSPIHCYGIFTHRRRKATIVRKKCANPSSSVSALSIKTLKNLAI